MSSRSAETEIAGRGGLGSSLALVLPFLDPALVGVSEADELMAAANALPPLHRAGFECRLAADDPAVDLQQGLITADGNPAVAARYLARQPASAPEWERVRRVCELCSSVPGPGSLAGSVAELWLELDRGDGPAGFLPSIFAVLEARNPALALRATESLVPELLGEDGPRLLMVLRRCAASCPPQARISHVGAMLGRQFVTLRVHVAGLPLQELGSYLGRIGWQGDIAEARAAAGMLLDHGDSLTVCLDLDDGVLPRLGLECFFTQQWGVDPRWRPLLRRLTETGLCSPAKAAALLRWPGSVTPSAAEQRWPEDLVVQSLLAPEASFGVIERRLSHVKLTCTAGAPLSAKAYFGFGHVWHRASAPSGSPVAVRARRSPAGSVAVAVQRATEYLLARRNQAGWWRDFFDRARPRGADQRVTGYSSDEWVTAYVAAALATVDRAHAQSAARDALRLLQNRRDAASGWGYHALLPADSDTTTWVLRLAALLDAEESPRLAAARAFVRGQIGAGGGVRTYESGAAEALREYLLMDGSYSGWTAPHTCVTAAAATLNLSPVLLAHLRQAQRADGSWTGHWWHDDEYATAFAVEALAAAGDVERVRAAVAWCASRAADGDDASAFADALALKGMVNGRAAAGLADAAHRAARWLAAHQLQDGSWPPSARLRVPPPDAADPGDGPERTLTYVDDGALFTTATALSALNAYAIALRGR